MYFAAAPSFSGGLSAGINLRCLLSDFALIYHAFCVFLNVCILFSSAVLGYPTSVLLYALLLVEVVLANPGMRSIARSVTDNLSSIFLSGLFALLLVFMSALVAFSYFQAHAVDEVTLPNGTHSTEAACGRVLECVEMAGHRGVRDGAGLGGSLSTLSQSDPQYPQRLLFDVAFFFLLRILCLNIILGIIVDTFGNLRAEKEESENLLHNTCFVCGLPRQDFHTRGFSFKDHCRDHSLWAYLNFIILLRVKDPNEFDGLESYVSGMLRRPSPDLSWIPCKMTAKLASTKASDEKIVTDLIRSSSLAQSSDTLYSQLQTMRFHLAANSKMSVVRERAAAVRLPRAEEEG